MRYADLCWRGVHASDLGVIVTEQVFYKKPALRRETVTVPGRSGTLTLKQADAWECVTYAPGLAVRPDADIDAVCRWLQGSGQLIFGSMPDSVYEATLVDQIDVTEQVPGHPAGYRLLVPTFECQPYRYEVVPACELFGTDTIAGYNPKNVGAAPLITVTVTPGTVLTLEVTGCEAAVIETPTSDVESLQVILDCDVQAAYAADGTALDGVMLGDFPIISPGEWKLKATGENGTVQSVSVLPRWRSI